MRIPPRSTRSGTAAPLPLAILVALCAAAPAGATRDRPSDLVCVAKTASPASLDQGVSQDVTYTVEVHNAGTSNTLGATLTDALPGAANASFVSAPGCGEAAGVVTCNLGTLGAGATVTRDIVIHVADPMPGDDLTNVASVSATNDGNSSNNGGPGSSCEVDVPVVPDTPGVDLECLGKTASPTTLTEGVSEDVTYTVNIRNNGPDPATGVTIVDTLPGGVSFVSAGAGCSESAGTVTCDLGGLPAGGQASRSIVVQIADPAVGEVFSNAAAVSANELDVLTGNESCQVSVNVDPQAPTGCRVTGGGVDLAGNWDGVTFADGESGHRNAVNRYEFGGQAGANTGSQPQPKGEWTHHQQRGPDGSFTFHAGTASAPPGTEIDLITCSDPGFCNPARPAPNKQIDFVGVGSFRNIRDPSTPLLGVVPGATLHWFSVHIEDLGEPGKGGKAFSPSATCPASGSAGATASCDCPDFYRIAIHETSDPASPVIYQAEGYINGGNLQIHPPTGFDLN